MERYKWPSTPYASDFSTQELHERFYNHHVIITEKLDGENTTMTRDFIHARSVDSAHHESRSPVKALWGSIRHIIPDNTYLVGENLAAKHSIYYPQLDGCFYLFAVLRLVPDGAMLMPWAHTKKVAESLGLPTVPVLVETITYPDKILGYEDGYGMRQSRLGAQEPEGYVVRREGNFMLDKWKDIAVKWVRPNHVQTDEHWMYQPVVWNGSPHV